MDFSERSPEEASPDLARYRVVDVREPHEYVGPLGHIEGAQSLPLGRVADAAGSLRDSQPLLLVCRSGKRSGMACAALQERGVADVTNLAGGMIAWNRAGLPVVHHPPADLAALVEQIAKFLAQSGVFDANGARAAVAEQLGKLDATPEAPTRDAARHLIDFVGDALAATPPPDLEPCLARFRHWLAEL